jgi:hypothetical protein
MSFLLRQVAHCDVCGHEWLTSKVPSHCAKCKSRKWNPPVTPIGPEGPITRTEAMLDILAPSARKVPPAGSWAAKHAATCKCLMCKPPKSSQSSLRS